MVSQEKTSENLKKINLKKLGTISIIGLVLATIPLILSSGFFKNSAPQINKEKDSLASDPRFTNYEKLLNQATASQVSKYIDLISKKDVSLDEPKYSDEVNGVFSGFDTKYVQAVTYTGVKKFAYDKNLIILKQEKIKTSASESADASSEIISGTDVDKNVFFNSDQFGKYLQIILASDSKTIKTILINE